MVHLESIEVQNVQSAIHDQLIDLTVQIASTADDVLDRIESILPGCDARVVAAAMLQKEKDAVWLEHATGLSQRS